MGLIAERKIINLLPLMPCILMIVAGCGRSELERGKVSGKITLQGKPLSAGKVTFVPEKGPSASGTLDADGRYTLTTKSRGDGAVVGRHRVAVSPLTPGVSLEPGKRPRAAASSGPPIPAKFQNVETSGLAADVQTGNNAFDFELGP